MRLLILNWRCPTHPNGGGAELLTLRIAERLVAWGHRVTWFAADYPGAIREEVINGIQIVRAGSQATVHLRAYRWYRRHGRGQFDAVIDEINTIPFFAHRYTGLPSVAFILQLAREVWWYEAPLPLASLGYVLEPLYLLAYRHSPVITISESSAAGLRAHGLLGPIAIIPMATDFTSEPVLPSLAEKEAEWTLVCLGRVVPSKRVDHAIRAIRHLLDRGMPVRLWVVGLASPAYQSYLERLAVRLGIGDHVIFRGKVDEDQKRVILRRAHLLVACSVREGWGLMVAEANAVGTPAVVYDAPGLRDSTRAGQTGLVCQPATPRGLAGAIAGLLSNPVEYERLRAAAWEQSRTLNWDRTAQGFVAAVEAALAGQARLLADRWPASGFDETMPIADPSLQEIHSSEGPIVSVVVPTRNEAAVIETLLRSLRAQTHSRIEIILVDNFSTDQTCQISQTYVDQLVQAGPERSAQRNLGARMAAGQIVMFLDADMKLEPGVVAEAVALFQAQPGVRMAAIPERSVGHNFWARCKALERDCYVDEPSVMAARVFDHRFFLELGGFDESLNGGEDWDLTQRAQRQAQMLILRQCLWHDEGRIVLAAQLRKKYYYARSFARYARKHPAEARRQANLLFRPAYFRHWRELAQHPLWAAGMIALRLLEGLAGLTGILVQQLRANPDQR